MNISHTTSLARPQAASADSTPAAAPARAAAPAPAPEAATDAFAQPTPPRFPWLSRLAEKLEAASNKPATFPPAPVIGDNLNQSA